MTDAVRLDDLASPQFSAEAQQILDMMAAMAPDCPLDADALHARASADTGLHDFGPDDYRERLDVYLAALRDIDGAARRRGGQLLRAAAATAQEPVAVGRPAAAGTPRSTTSNCGRRW